MRSTTDGGVRSQSLEPSKAMTNDAGRSPGSWSPSSIPSRDGDSAAVEKSVCNSTYSCGSASDSSGSSLGAELTEFPFHGADGTTPAS